ncbi:MAG: PAS domain S-box protein, partial [Ignavibacteriaceae bacterium]|nr:PAS domain S-box protein [Ignavibacteriaceae bacterium]
QVLATHQTVISDVFMSVQGYLAVAMHVPVFKGKEFKGSIAILIQIDKLGKQYFGKIKIRETSNAWLLSENGIEIFCLIKGHTGKSFLDITHNDPSTIELMKKLKKENKGNAISIHEEKSIDGQTEFIEKHITFYRVPLGNTYWTIIISHNEEDIYAALDSFRNRLILIFTFLFIVLIYYFYSLAKVRTLLNEEAKRKETEKTLYESEEKFRTLFETAVEGILIADLKNRKFKYSNPAICQMLGYNEVEFRQLGVEDIHPKESLEHVRAEFEAQAKGEKTLAAGLPCLRKDGSILYVDINTSMAVIDGEECNIGFFTDITERKKSEKDLLESQANITDLVKHTPDGVLIANTDGKHLFANQRMCEMTGYDYEELMNLTIREMTPPDELKKYQEMYDKRLKGEKVPSQYERTLVRKDGKVIPVELRTTTTIWNGAKCSLAFLTDISERKLSEETLKQSQLKYKQLFNDDLTGNFVISLDGTIELCNPAMAKIFGCDSVDELMKSN